MAPGPRHRERLAHDGHVAVLPASAASAPAARDLVRRVLPASVSPDQTTTVELLATEVVTNAVVHAGTRCKLRLRFPREDVLRVEVTDYGGGVPAMRAGDLTDPSGHGLELVDALASRWGTTRATPHGKTVWFEAAL